MSDLISREAALDAIKSYCNGCDNYSGVRCSSCMIDYAIIPLMLCPPSMQSQCGMGSGLTYAKCYRLNTMTINAVPFVQTLLFMIVLAEFECPAIARTAARR